MNCADLFYSIRVGYSRWGLAPVSERWGSFIPSCMYSLCLSSHLVLLSNFVLFSHWFPIYLFEVYSFSSNSCLHMMKHYSFTYSFIHIILFLWILNHKSYSLRICKLFLAFSCYLLFIFSVNNLIVISLNVCLLFGPKSGSWYIFFS